MKTTEDKYPSHSDGLIDVESNHEVREDFRSEYGEDSFELLFTNRERKMAGRAKWVSEQVEGKVLLVVGAAHLYKIVEFLEKSVDSIEVESRRARHCRRATANMNPLAAVFFLIVQGLKEVDWPSIQDINSYFRV